MKKRKPTVGMIRLHDIAFGVSQTESKTQNWIMSSLGVG